MKNTILILLPLLICSLAFSCHAQMQPVPQHGILLKWGASPDTGIDSYQVSRSITPGGPYAATACVTNGALQCLDTFPTGDVTGKFFYVVQAHHPVNGWSAPSNEAIANGVVPKNTSPASGVATATIQ